LQFFEDPARALAWLGLPPNPALFAELDALQAAAIGTPPLLRDLEVFLLARLAEIDAPRAAAGLGLSSRTLQRRLKALGTSFQEVLDRVRVETAMRHMEREGASIKEVAHVVGCRSVSRFTELFRQRMGLTPSEWRAKRSMTAR
jgi:AraC-like DNA-binding protein